MELWVATTNTNKLRELRQLLEPQGHSIRSLADLDHPLEIIEDGATFAANAAIKARALHAVTGQPALADDSGLMVDALGGAPGIHSARYAGINGPQRDKANYVKLLAELDGVPDEERGARFVCALVYIDQQGSEHLFEGACAGQIEHRPQGNNGFGYDPVFEVHGHNATMAELDPDIKNTLSHRGQAVRALLDFLARQRTC